MASRGMLNTERETPFSIPVVWSFLLVRSLLNHHKVPWIPIKSHQTTMKSRWNPTPGALRIVRNCQATTASSRFKRCTSLGRRTFSSILEMWKNPMVFGKISEILGKTVNSTSIVYILYRVVAFMVNGCLKRWINRFFLVQSPMDFWKNGRINAMLRNMAKPCCINVVKHHVVKTYPLVN